LIIVKSPYLRNRLSDFDVICHADAEPALTPSAVKIYTMFKLKTVDVSHSYANRLANVEVPGICKFKMAASRHLKAINYYFN